jgi:hypothetical protein
MATLGAKLGCCRHLTYTIGTGSRERSSAFFAELRLQGVLVLALRAFHRKPRMKKRARRTVTLTQRVNGNKVCVPIRTVRAAFTPGAANLIQTLWSSWRSRGDGSQLFEACLALLRYFGSLGECPLALRVFGRLPLKKEAANSGGKRSKCLGGKNAGRRGTLVPRTRPIYGDLRSAPKRMP